MTNAALLLAVPVDPDAAEARRWMIDELSGPEYAAARPTLLDRAAAAVGDWLASLTLPTGEGLDAVPWIVAGAVVIGAAIAGILLAGRIGGGGRRSTDAVLFGEVERRTARRLEEDARRAAARGDFAAAILDGYRATARRLAEEGVVAVLPGTTAQDAARRGGEALPALGEDLRLSAAAFDGVRYLGGSGDAESYLPVARTLDGLGREIAARRAARRAPQEVS